MAVPAVCVIPAPCKAAVVAPMWAVPIQLLLAWNRIDIIKRASLVRIVILPVNAAWAIWKELLPVRMSFRIEKAHKKVFIKKCDCSSCHVNELRGYQLTNVGTGTIPYEMNPYYKYGLYYGIQQKTNFDERSKRHLDARQSNASQRRKL